MSKVDKEVKSIEAFKPIYLPNLPKHVMPIITATAPPEFRILAEVETDTTMAYIGINDVILVNNKDKMLLGHFTELRQLKRIIQDAKTNPKEYTNPRFVIRLFSKALSVWHEVKADHKKEG